MRIDKLLGGIAAGIIPYIALTQPALAQSAPPVDETLAQAPAAEAPVAPEYHDQDGSEIVVTGFRRNREDILSGTAILSGDELSRELRSTIGETLARQPGVSATSFGPNASRPVLRGMQGERVRVLTDGIGSLDVSNTSVDHAVAINPLTAERVEVLRGPAALLFGSGAIGGVVNVIDARIPRRVPDEAVHAQGIFTYATAANERSANAAVDVPVGDNFVVHVDGNYSRADDLRVGGYLLAPALRAQAATSADPAIRDLARLKHRLPNSAARTWDVAAGAAFVRGDTNIGVSANHYDSLYGVPLRYSLDPAVEAEAPRIRIGQDRFDLRADIDTGSGFVDMLRLRTGYSDYAHDELEEDGAIGTSFSATGFEARFELVQSARGGWGGGIGAQYFRRDFDVVGEEKFLPRNRTSQFGLFTVQSLERGRLRAELGARYENSEVRADADADIGNAALERSFHAFSGSIGASYTLSDALRFGVNASHAQRAPSAEELFAGGPHAGTQAFEIGDPNLDVEKSWSIEATLHAETGGLHVNASLYHSQFSDYIFEQRTGGVIDDLPVFRIQQAGARYSGFEVEASAQLTTIAGAAITLDALADYTKATIRSAGPAPRIPPLRLLGGIEAKAERIQSRLEVEWADAQNRLADLETPTDSYMMVNLSLAFQPFKASRNTSITLSANNIFDVDARRHASFLKDFAPLAGRDIRISAQLSL